jgi:hypothetical protein
MPKTPTTTAKKADKAVSNVVAAGENDDLFITPQQYEAITAANRDCPISKLALRMFLHINYLWHIARAMQGKNKDLDAKSIDWRKVEFACVRTLRAAIPSLLKGVDPDVFAPEDENDSEYQKWEKRSKIRNIGV